MEKAVHISGRRDHPDMQESQTSLREVNICCMKCKKSYRLTYTEIGSHEKTIDDVAEEKGIQYESAKMHIYRTRLKVKERALEFMERACA